MHNRKSHKVNPVAGDIDDEVPAQVSEGTKAFAGYLLISRCLVEHDVVGFGRPGTPADSRRGCYSHAEAWQYLLMQAAYKNRTYKVGTSTYNLSRGELVASERFLAEKWNWTRKAVRYFVTKLRAHNMLERGPNVGPKAATLSICNYDKYQAASVFRGPQNDGVGAHSAQNWGPNLKKVLEKKDSNNIGELRSPHPNRVGAAAATQDQPTLDLGLDEGTSQPDAVASAPEPSTEPASEPANKPAKAKRACKSAATKDHERSEAITKAFEVWARVASDYGLPACRSVSKDRRSKMGQRLDSVGGSVAEFERVLRREVEASDFLRGKVKPQPGSKYRSQFECSIDFILQPSSWDKFVDGVYSRRAPAPRPNAEAQRRVADADADAALALTREYTALTRKHQLDRIRSNQKSSAT